MLRMRYWHEGARTAWIIDEVGKEQNITFGVVVENGEVQSLSAYCSFAKAAAGKFDIRFLRNNFRTAADRQRFHEPWYRRDQRRYTVSESSNPERKFRAGTR